MSHGQRIAALSIAAQELDAIRQLLERVRGQLGQAWQWSPEAEADVLLIDVDSVYGHMDWLRASAAGRRVISLTNRPAAEDEAVLRRPVTADGLIAALRQFEAGVTARGTATATHPVAKPAMTPATPAPAPTSASTPVPPASAPAAPASAAAATPAPAPAPAASATPPVQAVPAPATAPVQAELLTAAAAEPANAPRAITLADFLNQTALPGPARLSRGDTPALTIDATNDCWYGPATLKPLLPYCSGPVDKAEWQPVSTAVMEGLRAAGGAQPLARLLWLIALANSGGQLLPGLSPNARYRLARWPQIEREFPKHFRIATVMMKGWATLAEISEQAGATLAEVIDVVNAYTVSGHAEAEAESGAAAPVAAAATPMARLARLLRTPIGGG
jgi:hypothetical protein